MELTSAHLRYLLAIYEVSQTHLDISSRSIAEKLGVTKPSVVRIMNLLAAAAAITIAAALAAATAAAMLVRVPCDPAHTAKHDDCHNDRRQIKVCCQKFHHKASLLSADEAYLFAVILETSILTSLSPVYLLGRTSR